MIQKLVNPAIAKIPPYVAGRTIEQVQKETGKIVTIKLGSNENQYGPSPKAVKAMAEAAASANVYPDPMGIQLKEKLAEYYGLSADEIIVGNGSSTLLDVIGSVFICPGDEVVFCAPTFMLYHGITTANQGVPVMLPLTEDFTYDLEAMKAAITDKTKLVMICNPNNPTGTYLRKSALEEFICTLPSHVICIIDEAYIEYAEAEDCCSMLPMIKDHQVIVLRTFSKIWGLAGARVGMAAANPEIIHYLSAKIMTFNVNKMVIAGAIASLEDPDYLKMSYEGNKEGRAYLVRELEKMGCKVCESQTNFLFVDAGRDPQETAAAMEKKGIIIRGNFKRLRITIGRKDQNEAVIAALKEVLGVE